METSYDVIVVGAGIEGSATAYQLARAGTKTLLLEQFALLHTEGSSHGLSRATHRSYSQEGYACLMEDAHKEWRELEKLSGKTIYVRTGALQVTQKDHTETLEMMKKYNAPYKLLSAAELKEQYPHIVYSDKYNIFFDEEAGTLLADKGLTAFHEIFRKNGGTILENCTVTKINPGTKVIIETTKGKFTCNAVIVCAGTWAGNIAADLGHHLPIQFQRPYYMYWREKVVGTYDAKKGSPGFADHDRDIYGFPSLESPGLAKICIDLGETYDINKPGDDDKPPHGLEELRQYIRDHFPGLEDYPEIMAKCKYTMTPDLIFILERHPQHSNIIFGAGFSGKGFKFAPVVGNMLKDLALNQKPKYNMEFYSSSRFK